MISFLTFASLFSFNNNIKMANIYKHHFCMWIFDPFVRSGSGRELFSTPSYNRKLYSSQFCVNVCSRPIIFFNISSDSTRSWLSTNSSLNFWYEDLSIYALFTFRLMFSSLLSLLQRFGYYAPGIHQVIVDSVNLQRILNWTFYLIYGRGDCSCSAEHLYRYVICTWIVTSAICNILFRVSFLLTIIHFLFFLACTKVVFFPFPFYSPSAMILNQVEFLKWAAPPPYGRGKDSFGDGGRGC